MVPYFVGSLLRHFYLVRGPRLQEWAKLPTAPLLSAALFLRAGMRCVKEALNGDEKTTLCRAGCNLTKYCIIIPTTQLVHLDLLLLTRMVVIITIVYINYYYSMYLLCPGLAVSLLKKVSEKKYLSKFLGAICSVYFTINCVMVCETRIWT